MKKLNKKGFTLAELLIVIAIIAILIAIAIPAFSASLESARLQTDHANIRSAYAMFKTAELLGELETSETVEAGNFVFQKDGTLSKANKNPYKTQAAGSTEKCTESAACSLVPTNKYHSKNKEFGVTVAGSSAPYTYSFYWS